MRGMPLSHYRPMACAYRTILNVSVFITVRRYDNSLCRLLRSHTVSKLLNIGYHQVVLFSPFIVDRSSRHIIINFWRLMS